MLSDLSSIFQWWLTIFLIGIIFTPLTNLIFPNFFDKGYIFAKVIGIALISYTVFVLGLLKILPFETQNIFLVVAVFLLINFFINKKSWMSNFRSVLPIIILEECTFILILIFWSLIHAHQPEIHGLEKYMDYGFINSILRAKYFPPLDMWFTPYSINYYYFGHLVAAVLTKLSNLPSSITFNLALSTISALSFVSAFSIGANLIKNFKLIIGGLITAFILNFAGNLHTIYLFFKPYINENPVPFWQLIFSPQTFPNSYWYPNATRFIHNTIHEFPLYSYVVSDLHGHVLDIPFVLLAIAVLLSLFFKWKLEIARPPATLPKQSNVKQASVAGEVGRGNWKLEILLISFLLAIIYMTNAWDGIIYLLLSAIIIAYVKLKPIKPPSHQSIKYYVSGIKKPSYVIPTTLYLILIFVGFFLFSLPLNLNFKPFVSGIGILCGPKFLTSIGNFGPFIFETNHCQHSPLWQLFILYGFFYFWVFSFFVFLFRKTKVVQSDIFVLILIFLSTMLIIIPEFVYVKDIYPEHYRANTMFKLVYQSFIMLSVSSGYIIVRLFLNRKSLIINRSYWKFVYLFIGSIFILAVFLYPYFAINSYFGNLKIYSGLNGTNYLKPLYPNDYEAILWINKNITGQPVILEAQGDSYETYYARVSANTGLPTVLGWTVHEWLWRGSYDVPSPRIAEVAKMYESKNLDETKTLFKKYKVSLVFAGDLERQKYPNLNEEKFQSLGKVIYQKGSTKIFRVLH